MLLRVARSQHPLRPATLRLLSPAPTSVRLSLSQPWFCVTTPAFESPRVSRAEALPLLEVPVLRFVTSREVVHRPPFREKRFACWDEQPNL